MTNKEFEEQRSALMHEILETVEWQSPKLQDLLRRTHRFLAESILKDSSAFVEGYRQGSIILEVDFNVKEEMRQRR